jgi:hypothetical protein
VINAEDENEDAPDVQVDDDNDDDDDAKPKKGKRGGKKPKAATTDDDGMTVVADDDADAPVAAAPAVDDADVEVTKPKKTPAVKGLAVKGTPGKTAGTIHIKDAPNQAGGYSASGSTSGAGTKGRTDGEPGSAAAHCCGMKGLGGAVVDVMCNPSQIALGKEFTVNVKYASDVKRPVDVHVDVLNAETKAFYAGKWEEMDDLTGEVSLTIKMSDQAQEPFLWKVFVAPRGEPFPNMLAETGFVAHLGPTVEGNCVPFKSKGATPDVIPRVNFVMLNTVPEKLTPGATAPVVIDYDLVTGEEATIGVSLMRAGPNSFISGKTVNADAGLNQVTIDLPVPADQPMEKVYIVATLTPVGKLWEDRLGEDRSYKPKIAARRLRTTIEANGRLA